MKNPFTKSHCIGLGAALLTAAAYALACKFGKFELVDEIGLIVEIGIGAAGSLLVGCSCMALSCCLQEAPVIADQWDEELIERIDEEDGLIAHINMNRTSIDQAHAKQCNTWYRLQYCGKLSNGKNLSAHLILAARHEAQQLRDHHALSDVEYLKLLKQHGYLPNKLPLTLLLEIETRINAPKNEGASSLSSPNMRALFQQRLGSLKTDKNESTAETNSTHVTPVTASLPTSPTSAQIEAFSPTSPKNNLTINNAIITPAIDASISQSTIQHRL